MVREVRFSWRGGYMGTGCVAEFNGRAEGRGLHGWGGFRGGGA